MKLIEYLIILLIVAVSGTVGYLAGNKKTNNTEPSALQIVTRPLEKYSIENLSKAYRAGKIPPGKLTMGETIDEQSDYISRLFYFEFDPDMDDKNLKTITGQINLPLALGAPEEKSTLPLVLMLRGYVDQEIYTTGIGTSSAAAVFAQNGYITIAPDFLGYAGSDNEAEDIMESRFQTYVTTLALLASLDQIDAFDDSNLFIWGHSNGGQIALTVLEISGEAIPTTLWAPVSKPFPYSVLYYTDESNDKGKFLRAEIAKFEDLYDADKYSIHGYYDQIKAPIQLHQGGADDAVPLSWSNTLANILDLDSTYYTYPIADHNMRPNWDSVVARDLSFFNNYLKP